MGSLFHVPLARAHDAAPVLRALRDAGLVVVAATGDGDTELGAGTDALLARPTAGSSAGRPPGIPDAVARAADHRVRIPIRGRAESLNLAAAAAICLYASTRAHAAAPPGPDAPDR